MANSGASMASPSSFNGGTPGGAANIVEATLMAVAKQQDMNNRPLKVPDLRQFGVGRRVNITA